MWDSNGFQIHFLPYIIQQQHKLSPPEDIVYIKASLVSFFWSHSSPPSRPSFLAMSPWILWISRVLDTTTHMITSKQPTPPMPYIPTISTPPSMRWIHTLSSCFLTNNGGLNRHLIHLSHRNCLSHLRKLSLRTETLNLLQHHNYPAHINNSENVKQKRQRKIKEMIKNI